MDQSLHGISFPRAAAAKAELLHGHNHDVVAPCTVCYPHQCKPKGIALPWMGFGVGAGKEAVILQDAMMKRKRDASSTAGSVGSEGIESTRKFCDNFESDYLRHDGHFLYTKRGRKKGPVCTFVKQYRLNRRKKTMSEIETQESVNESKSLEYYAPTAVVATEADSNLIKPLPICGVDCYQVRAEIFQKVRGLMAHQPEKLHIKARIKPNDPEMLGPLPPLQLDQPMYTVDAVCSIQSASTSDAHKEEPFQFDAAQHASAGAVTREHQAVQTVFTESKMVQTNISNEPKQVQWAIFPRDSLSPKVGKRAHEVHKSPTEIQQKDSLLLKVSKPAGEIHANDPLLYYGETDNTAKEMKQSPDDSPHLTVAKKTRGKHHLLLYQEAMEKAQEQKDLERAREQRQDFWSVYEQELKRGKGLNVEEVETENKGKRSAEEDLSETESPVEEVSGLAPVKIKLNAFLDEHLSLTSTSPVSSSPRDGTGSSEDAAAIVQQLLDKVGNFKVETNSNVEVLVGLQGLRKIEAGDSLQSLEAMEQQLNPETSQPHCGVHLSPTELDCMKAAILSHNFYPRLVTSFINQHKAGAPPDQVERLEKIRSQVMESWRPAGIPVEKPAHEEKIKKYQEILTRFERELEKPFQDAMDFSWQMEHYLDTIPPSRGRSEGGGSSGSNNLKDFDDELKEDLTL